MPADSLVSVVTPTLNQASFLGDAVASVLGQDHSRFEHIVVDGGSTDATPELLARYGTALRMVSRAGLGQSAALNEGWRLAGGEILGWLNSDDTYLPGALRQVVAFFDAHPEVAVVYGECDYVDAAGRRLRPYPTRPYDFRELVRRAVNYVPQPAAFVRRRALEAVGGLDESLHFAMDFDLWLRIGAEGLGFARLPARLATLRLHPAAKSSRGLEHFAPELVRVFERLFALPRLPGDVVAVRDEAISNVHYRASQCLFWAGRHREARAHALTAWRQRPSNLRPQLFVAAGGAFSRHLLQRWRGDPFRRGV